MYKEKCLLLSYKTIYNDNVCCHYTSYRIRKILIRNLYNKNTLSCIIENVCCHYIR